MKHMMTAMPSNTDYGTLTGNPLEDKCLPDNWQTQDIPRRFWALRSHCGSHGVICSQSIDAELVHQLVYNPALGFSPTTVHIGTIGGSHGGGVVDPRRSKINNGCIGRIRIRLSAAGQYLWDYAPLMSHDYEHYNLAVRNDERLFKKENNNYDTNIKPDLHD
jgi:hypothetical protein